MSVGIIDSKDVWDKFIDDSPYALLFHKWDFLKLMEKHTGYMLLPYGVFRGKELACVFPLFYKRSMGLKMFFSPPPRTAVPYLGPVMGPGYDRFSQHKRESYLGDAMDEMHKELSRLSSSYTSVSLVPGMIDVRPFKWNDYGVSTHFTYIIDLDRPVEIIWDEFGKDCRNSIRKCMKSHTVLERSYDTDAFYDIMKDRYGQQGLSLPLVSKEYLSGLVNAFPGNVMAFYVKDGPDVCDIELACGYKDRFMLWLGGASMQKNMSGYQEYATWELIKMAKGSGYKEFEIAGAGVRRICAFQSKFNPSMKFSFSILKTGLAGKAAELAYVNLIKRKWV